MTWPIFRFDQDDLRARSREPELFEREYYPLNHLYGGAEILRRYAELPEGRPLPWGQQAIMNYCFVPEVEGMEPERMASVFKLKDTGMPLSLTINETKASGLRGLGVTGVHEIGSVFFYAMELYRRKGFEAEQPERRGTLALPDKSDLFKLVDFDREAYAAKLAALPPEFHPVYVSMHWRDFDRGCHEPYQKAGLPMVCSGHPNDTLFYERFYDTCRHFKYACSNEISTSFALSVLSGCQFFFLDGGEMTIYLSKKDETYVGPEPTLESPGKKACVEASPFPPVEGGRERQLELANGAAGHQYFREPAFFRDLWRLGRDQLSRDLPAEDISLDDAPDPQSFARWLPFGIDRDGWADEVSGVEIPPREPFIGVEIELLFHSDRMPNGEAATFSWVIENHGEMGEANVPVRDGIQIFFVPFTETRQERLAVNVIGPPASALPNEQRQRSLRWRRIRWISARDDSSLSPEKESPTPPPESPPKPTGSWARKILSGWRS
jgi:hypothetical protein